MIRTRIMATGACVPEQIITNDDLAKVVDTSDEWIMEISVFDAIFGLY